MALKVTFATSTSLLFPAALEIAAQAAEFTEEPVGKIKRYRAVFGRTPEQAELAVALLQHLDNIKGVLVHAGGRLGVNQDAVIATLGCFIASEAGGGIEAYCHRLVDAPPARRETEQPIEIVPLDDRPPPQVTYPCTKLLATGFMPQPERQVTAADQIQAEAVRIGCDWCPNFNPESWRKL
ncbi:hypothetical protein ACJBUE_12650 [Ralstonia syzygii subsp. celebesensis]|uniref:hypothetical protein n=1 Tax=Ralstonia syzygii TaxID=28097 RepID=UPI00387E16F1